MASNDINKTIYVDDLDQTTDLVNNTNYVN